MDAITVKIGSNLQILEKWPISMDLYIGNT